MRWWERVSAWDEKHRFVMDAVAAGLTALLVVPSASSFSVTENSWIGLASLAQVVPLAWRRVRPTASAVAVFSVALVHFLAGELLIVPVDFLVLVALYSVTVHGPVWAYRTAIIGALTGSAMFGGAAVLESGSLVTGGVFAVALALLALSTFAFGLVRRARRESIDSLVDRALRLEVERDQQAQIATAAERARIAREMHDIVAHSLSVIIAQADGGRYAAENDPAAATRSLTTIAETGRAALTDMRRLLGVLRPSTDDATGGLSAGAAVETGASTRPAPHDTETGAPALAPQPAVGDIDQLVEQVRGSGVDVSVVRMGTARRLPPGIDLTVYRICQESLTNILKHAGPSPSATVMLQWKPEALVLQVSDDGRGAAAETDGVGQGVLGMRERAAMLGGTLTVGPRPGGGYRVRAEIPIPPHEEHR
ncbi:sensor histidine kinase [Actinotalea sp. BY-33]|uniref:histidine kinase n=1 Tax=Actinotalea soli TaxID=2819234 RepID=A0A939LNS8_9CELL|nr:sensor histidine kinase [Actinotalea soli]MBO1750974.1 sensor histidine kinase [Actinotalea soli]